MNAPPTFDPPLELRNVTKFYGDFKAVDDVSFTLPAGSICGFLGPNGAGKTTTIRMILEIIKPSSGAITVLGRPSALEVRQHLGYLPEEKGLYKKMKTWSVIAYFATLKGLSRSAARQRSFELLERYGLKDFAAKTTESLSKGMAQKVQMLASIAHDPELVILDEPFSGLDPVNQQVMEEIIATWPDASGPSFFRPMSCNMPNVCASGFCSWLKAGRFSTAQSPRPNAPSPAACASKRTTTLSR